jgi:hypothetical protein
MASTSTACWMVKQGLVRQSFAVAARRGDKPCAASCVRRAHAECQNTREQCQPACGRQHHRPPDLRTRPLRFRFPSTSRNCARGRLSIQPSDRAQVRDVWTRTKRRAEEFTSRDRQRALICRVKRGRRRAHQAGERFGARAPRCRGTLATAGPRLRRRGSTACIRSSAAGVPGALFGRAEARRIVRAY